jgi:penicillin-binding protein-related factor A (putative recombinase)
MIPHANRGKLAEQKVRAELNKLDNATCVVFRPPDARAGSRVTSPGDYFILREGHLTLIEVKSVAHNFRVPHGNFAIDQVARQRAWESAGADAWVIVYFSPLKLWRAETVGYFMQRDGGSWDMRHIEAKTLPEIMKEIFQ